MTKTEYLQVATQGFNDIINITGLVSDKVAKSKIFNGIVNVSCPGSTAGITTIEFESGAVDDLKQALEEIAPMDAEYKHNLRWNDGNGYAHVRSALLKPFFSAPVIDGDVILGTWQQIIFIDFDNKPRTRKLIVQIIGE